MEIVDNAVMLLIPGAMDSHLDSPVFWASLAFAPGVAFVAAFPVNRYLIARSKGHAVVHKHHQAANYGIMDSWPIKIGSGRERPSAGITMRTGSTISTKAVDEGTR